MNRNSKTAAATAARVAGAPAPIKERIFSIIRKLENEGITDGRRRLWIDFTPHVTLIEQEDGYTLWLWREGVVIKITLDREFNVTGVDVEGSCR
jgi:hypothetical protein